MMASEGRTLLGPQNRAVVAVNQQVDIYYSTPDRSARRRNMRIANDAVTLDERGEVRGKRGR